MGLYKLWIALCKEWILTLATANPRIARCLYNQQTVQLALWQSYIIKNLQKVGMLLQKRRDTRGVGDK